MVSPTEAKKHPVKVKHNIHTVVKKPMKPPSTCQNILNRNKSAYTTANERRRRLSLLRQCLLKNK